MAYRDIEDKHVTGPLKDPKILESTIGHYVQE